MLRTSRTRQVRWQALAIALAMVAVACGGGDGDGGGEATPEVTGGAAIETGVGVTEEPCQDAPTGSEDRGCIYLGILSDLTEGPFAPLAQQITAAQEAFWDRVNEDGGIGGYDVDVRTYTRDNKYDPEEHNAQYLEIEPNILALAQSLGTPPTLGSLADYEADNMVAVAVTWWSGWEFQPLLLQSGYNYCIESMNAIDYALDNFEVASVQSVHYPGDYGGDSAEGARIGAEARDIEFVGAVETLPNSAAGSQDAAVDQVLQGGADLVIVATGPAEFGEIVAKSVAQGFEGQFIGSVPTINPALMADPDVAQAMEAAALIMAPWGPWGTDTPAHDAMQEAFGEGAPDNDGWTYGWVWSYPLKAVLEQAVENGTLTREALVEAVEQVTVDYEGALPEKSYAGDPNETVVRESLVTAPDPEAPTGFSITEEFFVGQTAENYDFAEPCIQLG